MLQFFARCDARYTDTLFFRCTGLVFKLNRLCLSKEVSSIEKRRIEVITESQSSFAGGRLSQGRVEFKVE